MKSKVNKEAQEAIDEWDREHSENTPEEEDYINSLVGEKMTVEIVLDPANNDSKEIVTIVDLPSSKPVAEVMLTTIVKTMAIASNETPEEVLMKLAQNLGKGLISNAKPYSK